MKHHVFAALAGALLLSATLASAQQLAATGSSPKLDGVVSEKEYSYTTMVGKLTLSASRTADTVFLAVSAPTTGWVSVGFGSEKMDGAKLFLGYVAGGKPSFSQQLGAGHGHGAPASELQVRDALGEAGGATTLETAFKASQVIAEGQKELWVLFAYGPDDTFSSYHVARASIKIQL
jgi:hypothetical protein